LKEGRESAEDNEGSGKWETITPYEENKNTEEFHFKTTPPTKKQ
jgi:hypothetical protein